MMFKNVNHSSPPSRSEQTLLFRVVYLSRTLFINHHLPVVYFICCCCCTYFISPYPQKQTVLGKERKNCFFYFFFLYLPKLHGPGAPLLPPTANVDLFVMLPSIMVHLTGCICVPCRPTWHPCHEIYAFKRPTETRHDADASLRLNSVHGPACRNRHPPLLHQLFTAVAAVAKSPKI